MGCSPTKCTAVEVLHQEYVGKESGMPDWTDEAGKAAGRLLQSAALDNSGVCNLRDLAEASMVLKSRMRCKFAAYCSEAACRYSHPGDDGLLWSGSACSSLVSPKTFSQEVKKVKVKGSEWRICQTAYEQLGPEAFVLACRRQAAALDHFKSREGARIICRGLPQADELQAFAMKRVTDIWGDVIHLPSCQEYLDRSAARVKSHITGGDYSAPGRNPVTGHWGGPQATVATARIIKVGINNPNVKFESGDAKRDTAWHGCQARSLNDWRPATRNTPPCFRVDKSIHNAHSRGIYVSPSFEQAVLYAFRKWDKAPRFATMKNSAGEKWNYLTVMQLALYDRGRPGVVDECKRTWPNASTDGWDANKLEWVVRDPSKAQIYGILFCFFPDDPAQGG